MSRQSPDLKAKGRETHQQAIIEGDCSKGLAGYLKGGNAALVMYVGLASGNH